MTNTQSELRHSSPRRRRGPSPAQIAAAKNKDIFPEKGGEYFCPDCDYHNTKRRAVVMHYNRMHTRAIQVPTKAERERFAVVGRQAYHCPNCTKELTDLAVLHFRKHPNGGDAFHCVYCGRSILKSTRGWMEENVRAIPEPDALIIAPAVD